MPTYAPAPVGYRVALTIDYYVETGEGFGDAAETAMSNIRSAVGVSSSRIKVTGVTLASSS